MRRKAPPEKYDERMTSVPPEVHGEGVFRYVMGGRLARAEVDRKGASGSRSSRACHLAGMFVEMWQL